MNLSAEAVEFRFKRRKIDVQVRTHAKYGEVGAAGRRLNLAAVGAEQRGSAAAYGA
jgi:hypothetical protein